MALSKDTENIQIAVGRYCRSGEVESIANVPGLTPHRVGQYRRLVSNIVVDNMRSAFPIANKILGEDTWTEISLDFFKNHKCQSTQVWQLPKEFANYILNAREDLLKEFPFLFDLVRLEWTEMEVFGMPDEEKPKTEPIKTWERDKQIAVNPERRLLELAYPVHRSSEKASLQKKEGPYFILVFREPQTFKARFFELAPIYIHLLDCAESGLTFGESLAKINETLEGDLNASQISSIQDTLSALYNRGAILGFMA